MGPACPSPRKTEGARRSGCESPCQAVPSSTWTSPWLSTHSPASSPPDWTEQGGRSAWRTGCPLGTQAAHLAHRLPACHRAATDAFRDGSDLEEDGNTSSSGGTPLCTHHACHHVHAPAIPWGRLHGIHGNRESKVFTDAFAVQVWVNTSTCSSGEKGEGH